MRRRALVIVLILAVFLGCSAVPKSSLEQNRANVEAMRDTLTDYYDADTETPSVILQTRRLRDGAALELAEELERGTNGE